MWVFDCSRTTTMNKIAFQLKAGKPPATDIRTRVFAPVTLVSTRWPLNVKVSLIFWRRTRVPTINCLRQLAIRILEPDQDPFHAVLLLWSWHWSDDLDIRNSPGNAADVAAYQKWSFWVKALKSWSITNRQTDRDVAERIAKQHVEVAKITLKIITC